MSRFCLPSWTPTCPMRSMDPTRPTMSKFIQVYPILMHPEVETWIWQMQPNKNPIGIKTNMIHNKITSNSCVSMNNRRQKKYPKNTSRKTNEPGPPNITRQYVYGIFVIFNYADVFLSFFLCPLSQTRLQKRARGGASQKGKFPPWMQVRSPMHNAIELRVNEILLLLQDWVR